MVYQDRCEAYLRRIAKGYERSIPGYDYDDCLQEARLAVAMATSAFTDRREHRYLRKAARLRLSYLKRKQRTRGRFPHTPWGREHEQPFELFDEAMHCAEGADPEVRAVSNEAVTYLQDRLDPNDWAQLLEVCVAGASIVRGSKSERDFERARNQAKLILQRIGYRVLREQGEIKMSNIPAVDLDDVAECHALGESPVGYDSADEACWLCRDKFTCLPEGLKKKLVDGDIKQDMEVAAVSAGKLAYDVAIERMVHRYRKLDAGEALTEEETHLWDGLLKGEPAAPVEEPVPAPVAVVEPEPEEDDEEPEEVEEDEPEVEEDDAEDSAEDAEEEAESEEDEMSAAPATKKRKKASSKQSRAVAKPRAVKSKAKAKTKAKRTKTDKPMLRKPKAKAAAPKKAAPKKAPKKKAAKKTATKKVAKKVLTVEPRGAHKYLVLLDGTRKGRVVREGEEWGWYTRTNESPEWLDSFGAAIEGIANELGASSVDGSVLEVHAGVEANYKPRGHHLKNPEWWPNMRDGKPYPHPKELSEEAMEEKLAEAQEKLGVNIELDYGMCLVRRMRKRDAIAVIRPNGFEYTIPDAELVKEARLDSATQIFSSLSAVAMWAEGRLRTGNDFFNVGKHLCTEVRDEENRILDR